MVTKYMGTLFSEIYQKKILKNALLGGSYGQLENITSVDDAINMASNGVNIPGFNVSALPVEEAKQAVEKKCNENGGPEAFINASNATLKFQQCAGNLIDRKQLELEMEPAKKTGDLDRVFKKYCNKSPILKNCVKEYTDSIAPCLNVNERKTLKTLHNITESLLKFICYKDGDRIALFISAGGPECLTSKEKAMQDCVNSTFSNYIPESRPSSPAAGVMEVLPMLVLDTEKCEDLDKLQVCISNELRKCDDATPENFVSSLFKYIKDVTPCGKLLQPRNFGTANGPSPTIIFVNVVAVAISLLAFGLSQ